MLTLKEAIEIARSKLPEGYTLCEQYGEISDKYVFNAQNSHGTVPPGGFNWTVHKETGEYKCEYLEREFLAPYAPIKGYKKIELPKSCKA